MFQRKNSLTKQKTFSVFLMESVYKFGSTITRFRRVIVSTAVPSSFKAMNASIKLFANTENVFSISFGKNHTENIPCFGGESGLRNAVMILLLQSV